MMSVRITVAVVVGTPPAAAAGGAPHAASRPAAAAAIAEALSAADTYAPRGVEGFAGVPRGLDAIPDRARLAIGSQVWRQGEVTAGVRVGPVRQALLAHALR